MVVRMSLADFTKSASLLPRAALPGIYSVRWERLQRGLRHNPQGDADGARSDAAIKSVSSRDTEAVERAHAHERRGHAYALERRERDRHNG
jgi:hypothetical protein